MDNPQYWAVRAWVEFALCIEDGDLYDVELTTLEDRLWRVGEWENGEFPRIDPPSWLREGVKRELSSLVAKLRP